MLKKGALNPDSTYSLKVEIKNTKNEGMTGFQILDFQTQLPPYYGDFSVTPKNGTMFST